MKGWALVGLLLATCWAYRGVRSAGWVYEDANFVTENRAVTGQEGVQIGRARWLANLMNRVQWVHAPSAPAFHLVNLALHLLNGLLVYALAWTLTRSSVVSWLAAAVFLLHPIQSEAVAYVAGRTELLAAFFALSAWLVWARAERWWAYAGVWLLVLAAVSCKESAAVIVPLFILNDVVHGRKVAWRWSVLALIPVLAMAYSVFRWDYQGHVLGPFMFAATQAVAVWRYLALVVVPYGFTVDHDYELVAHVWRWLALWGVAAVWMLSALLLMSVGNERHERVSLLVWGAPEAHPILFGVLWALIALLPRFVVPQTEILNEHQMLMPMVGISLAIAALVGPRLSSRIA